MKEKLALQHFDLHEKLYNFCTIVQFLDSNYNFDLIMSLKGFFPQDLQFHFASETTQNQITSVFWAQFPAFDCSSYV